MKKNNKQYLFRIIFITLATLMIGTSPVSSATENTAYELDTLFEDDRLHLLSIDYRWSGKHKDAHRWAEYVSEAIDDYGLLKNSTPGDITTFCPKYKNLGDLEKRMFWIYLVSSIAELESYFQPASSYTEDFNDSSGTKVVSRGLLQLSFESAQLYDCPVKKGTDLYSAEINLNCGVKILDRWIAQDGVIAGKSGNQWLGAGRYWSIFRYKLPKIKGWTKSVPFCN